MNINGNRGNRKNYSPYSPVSPDMGRKIDGDRVRGKMSSEGIEMLKSIEHPCHLNRNGKLGLHLLLQ